MGRNISGNYSTEVQLTLSSDNPVTVTGTIAVNSGIALFGNAATDWFIYNEGRLAADASGSGLYGIDLALGNITNTGTITAWEHAVQLGYGGSVYNAAGGTIGGGFIGVLISADLTTKTQAGTLTNAGTITYGPGNYSENGVFLGFGGSATNLLSGLIKVSRTGVYIANAAGSVVNAGTIITSKTIGTGIQLNGSVGASEVLSNASTGLIIGGGIGVHIAAGIASIINQGTLIGNASYGVLASQGGTITNASGATISSHGSNGVRIFRGPCYVENAGLISNTVSGIYQFAVNVITGTLGPAYVSNATSGTIIGGAGVGIGGAPGTVVNAGTIEATAPGGNAVQFFPGRTNSVVVDPGAVFVGNVNGGNAVGATAVSTLELASAASTGTLSGIGSHYINFAQITDDPGASWELAGTNSISTGAVLTNGGTLKLLGASLIDAGGLVNDGVINIDPSTLTVAGIYGVGTLDIGANSTLTINGTVAAGETIVFTGTSAVLNILHSSSFAGTILDQGPTDQVNISCFATGTRLTTVDGEVRVEDLRVGDRLRMALQNVAVPIIWLGQRSIDCTRHTRPAQIWPVRVVTDAFGPGRPCRDLWLSPDHALYINDVLIPVKQLINGASVVQVPVDEVTYYHVELSRHDVLLAERLPCESYLDTGNRGAFANGGPVTQMHPEFALRIWETEACAPLVLGGVKLEEARRKLLARFPQLGYTVTEDPELRFLADGQEPIEPQAFGDWLCLAVPDGATTLCINSRQAAPLSTKRRKRHLSQTNILSRAS